MDIVDFFIGPTEKITGFLYQPRHLITLGCVIALTLLIVLLFRKKSQKTKRTLLWSLTSILIMFEIASRVVHFIKGGDFFHPTVIPMHFCSIMVWMIIIAVIVNNKHMYTLSAMGGLIATVAFLLYPAVGFNVAIWKFQAYYSILSHSIGFIISVFLIAGGFAKFYLKDIWVAGLFLIANFAYSFLLNFWLYPSENFLYYGENLFPTPFWAWIIIYTLMVLFYFSSFFIIAEMRRKRKRRKEASKLGPNNKQIVG